MTIYKRNVRAFKMASVIGDGVRRSPGVIVAEDRTRPLCRCIRVQYRVRGIINCSHAQPRACAGSITGNISVVHVVGVVDIAARTPWPGGFAGTLEDLRTL